jgi:hypothetical protein
VPPELFANLTSEQTRRAYRNEEMSWLKWDGIDFANRIITIAKMINAEDSL